MSGSDKVGFTAIVCLALAIITLIICVAFHSDEASACIANNCNWSTEAAKQTCICLESKP